MTPKQFFDWHTPGGMDDVMRLVYSLDRADPAWCAVDGVAINYWTWILACARMTGKIHLPA